MFIDNRQLSTQQSVVLSRCKGSKKTQINEQENNFIYV